MSVNLDEFKAIFFDLDYTLAHYVGGMESFAEVMEQFDVPFEVAKKALDRANETGFSFALYFNLIERAINKEIDQIRAVQVCSQWMRQNYVLYPGVRDVLQELIAHNSKLEIFIITFGVRDFQRMKIKSFNFPRSIKVIYVGNKNSKYVQVKGIVQALGGKVLIIEDCPHELDACRDNGLMPADLETVRIMRPEDSDAPYANVTGKFRHQHVSTLSELFG
jgi:phosphoglycolate phosphatase-like HAD superfamily hydrolase